MKSIIARASVAATAPARPRPCSRRGGLVPRTASLYLRTHASPGPRSPPLRARWRADARHDRQARPSRLLPPERAVSPFDIWLIIVGLAIGAGLAWLVMLDLRRRDDDIAERPSRGPRPPGSPTRSGAATSRRTPRRSRRSCASIARTSPASRTKRRAPRRRPCPPTPRPSQEAYDDEVDARSSRRSNARSAGPRRRSRHRRTCAAGIRQRPHRPWPTRSKAKRSSLPGPTRTHGRGSRGPGRAPQEAPARR